MSALRDNAVTRLLACRYPILLAGMGGVARHELAVAVAHAGGFACMGMVREPPPLIEREVRAFRARCDATFGINLIPAATPKALLEEQVALCLRLGVPVMVLFWDVHTALIRRLKTEGVRVIHQVGSAVEAETAINAGADALIAQGIEAGGHVRGKEPTETLVTRLVAFSPVPVIAAGGIATGQDVARMLRLGARGVSCGTAFLATHESNAHDYHKQRIVAARAGHTVLTRVFWRNWHRPEPVRVLASSVTESGDDGRGTLRVIATQDGGPVYLNSTDSPLRGATGELHLMPLYAGESCARITAVEAAGDRLRAMAREAEEALDGGNPHCGVAAGS